MDELVTQNEFFVNCCPILDRVVAQEGSHVGDTTLPSSKKGLTKQQKWKANSSIEATTDSIEGLCDAA